MKKLFICIWLILLSAGIAVLFWYNEWVYTLPTPIPKNYKTVAVGEKIDVALHLKSTGEKPVFLHFFNPDCPCSRFNISHFKSLVKNYGMKANFVIVVISNKHFTVKDIQDKFNINAPVLFDTAIAVSCGVYSTPQAVILDSNCRLYYRGNYNKSRYCTNQESNYAQIALENLLNHNQHIVSSKFALQAYGCQLANCKK